LFEVAESARLRSWRTYAQRWRDHVGPAFGHQQAADVAPLAVDAYRANRRAEGASLATINREIALLRRLLNFGVRRGLLAKSRLHGPGMTRELIHAERNARTTVIEDDPSANLTLATLLEEAGDELRAFILLVHQNGMRRGEAALLRRDQINAAAGVAWIPSANTKGGRSGRTVPVSREALAAIAALPCVGDYVFASSRRNASPVTPDTWTHRFQRLVRRLGVIGSDGGPPWLHDLRRSFVTISRRDGEAERAIMNVTGHKTRAVFDRYDIHDIRDIVAFRERREAARLALHASGRKPPKRSSNAPVTISLTRNIGTHIVR